MSNRVVGDITANQSSCVKLMCRHNGPRLPIAPVMVQRVSFRTELDAAGDQNVDLFTDVFLAHDLIAFDGEVRAHHHAELGENAIFDAFQKRRVHQARFVPVHPTIAAA